MMNFTFKEMPPKLSVCLEANKRFGSGFQVSIEFGNGSIKTIDEEPFQLYDALLRAVSEIELINQDQNYTYDPSKVVSIDFDSIRKSLYHDPYCMQVFHDIEQQSEAWTDLWGVYALEVSVKKEVLFAPSYILNLIFDLWVYESRSKAEEILDRYFEYLVSHGYDGDAGAMLSELEDMDLKDAHDWIRNTSEIYVADKLEFLFSLFLCDY